MDPQDRWTLVKRRFRLDRLIVVFLSLKSHLKHIIWLSVAFEREPSGKKGVRMRTISGGNKKVVSYIPT